jgi:hypothetical protein
MIRAVCKSMGKVPPHNLQAMTKREASAYIDTLKNGEQPAPPTTRQKNRSSANSWLIVLRHRRIRPRVRTRRYGSYLAIRNRPLRLSVLKKHWPEVVNHGNIKEINWGDVVRPDIICGGYPCQPFSTAGKRNGTDDPRHFGLGLEKPLANYDLNTQSWRMYEDTFLLDSTLFSGKWPASGMTQNGKLFPQPQLVRRIAEIASLLWPTPTVQA